MNTTMNYTAQQLRDSIGKMFYAVINGIDVSGHIQLEDSRMFLCQNTIDGIDCTDKLGHKFSYIFALIHSDESIEIIDEDVYDLNIVQNVFSRSEVEQLLQDMYVETSKEYSDRLHTDTAFQQLTTNTVESFMKSRNI